jgi:hypothetical protein
VALEVEDVQAALEAAKAEAQIANAGVRAILARA